MVELVHHLRFIEREHVAIAALMKQPTIIGHV
jgi:hypothetical protein